MKVIIYVEGPSDKYAMEALLGPLIKLKQEEGISIIFFESPAGDAKRSLLVKIPIKAANIILTTPNIIVITVPDLYPQNKVFPHSTEEELSAGIMSNFVKAILAKGREHDERLLSRFKVFCFKHDLEALILAAKAELERRLGVRALPVSWQLPVENQNHNVPPKRIVENLFVTYKKRYIGTVDAPMILGNAAYLDIAEQCSQCFKPFVEFLVSMKRDFPNSSVQ